MIDSSSAKTLAQPTLLVQEGQEAEVETGTSVITSVSTTDTLMVQLSLSMSERMLV